LWHRIATFTDQHRLPSMWIAPEAVRDSALMAYTPNPHDMYQRTGVYVAKILGGVQPATLPMDRVAPWWFRGNMIS
jgi:ABC-type uncharacterized transport system substrate-binding protein